MKKYIIFIACAIISILTSCNEDFNVQTMTDEEISGLWYEPEYNEEVKFTESGRFYDKFCNKQMSSSIEGTYEISGNKLTRIYTLLGKSQVLSQKISNITANSFVMKSNAGNVVVYKVVETITMQPGETKSLPDNGYVSTDTRIATISGSSIKAEGLKGTLYLKNNDNTYVKVVVGDDILDLWYDYTGVLGCSVNEMQQQLGKPEKIEDGCAYYTDMHNTHDLIDYVGIIIRDDKVVRVILTMKNGVDENEIMSYMKQKYHYSSDANVFYSHQPQSDSKYMAQYDSQYRYLIFEEYRPAFVIPDFSMLFKTTKYDLKSRQFFEDYASIQSESNDSVHFAVNGVYGVENATFYFRGKGRLMNSYAVTLNKFAIDELVDEQLKINYQYIGEQTISGYNAKIYSNKQGSVTVVYYPQRKRIEYYDISQKEMPQITAYNSILGMTKKELINKFGAGYEHQSFLVYSINDEYFSDIYCRIGEKGTVDMYFYTLNSDTNISDIDDALRYNYTYLSYNSDKKMSTWINAKDKANATIGINFYESERKLYFFYIGK